MDRCPRGINRTIDTLNKAGIAHTGTRKSGNDTWHAVTRWQNMSIAVTVEEYVTNDGRRTMIAYSLGNFVSYIGY